MALTQQQRDEKRRAKESRAKVEDLRMKAGQGTRQALADIMQWAEVEENGEAMTLMIHRIHELGPEAALHFLSAPRHEIVISKYVEQSLERFRISRELRTPGLMLGEDPDDTGVLLLAKSA
ncbi:hypothetical protein PWA60_15265 [Pseudomonas juntendi]|uniref:Uncharacterized protein n=2 Tax=Pseudomonas juntendi TaxID=2666183 RepID=A0AAJ5V3J9_9PSED|nr:hypothetical protein [Pseudomonas juntendi]MBR7519882.1 hypothetical protein [Pseudomonas juntendi]WEA23101.1 hypothetical protein PWA60_15265 [Pseudomonas juntendi]